jgi:hypothetical protein
MADNARPHLYRYGAYINRANLPAIDRICEQYGVARASLLEVLALGVPENELAEIIERGKAVRKANSSTARGDRQRMIKELRSLPVDQLEKLLAESKQPAQEEPQT